MDVFISWSGGRSKGFAEALRDWLPQVINALRPWLSSADIDAGARWGVDVAGKLAIAKVGIICLTPGNLHSDWILFEAGALSKTLDNTYVCPLLLDLSPSDVKGPLSQFQAKRVNQEDMKALVTTLNTALQEKALASSQLERAFEKWWPDLERVVLSLPQENATATPERSQNEMLAEILELVRGLTRVPRLPEWQPDVVEQIIRSSMDNAFPHLGYIVTRIGERYYIELSAFGEKVAIPTEEWKTSPRKLAEAVQRRVTAMIAAHSSDTES